MNERYNRHTILEKVGKKGQEYICKAKVLVIGAGGLGSPILLYLTAAGVGTLAFMDDDIVSESNLQRQIIYDSMSLGLPKVEVACKRLSALNPECNIIGIPERLSAQNTDYIKDYDIIVDATDNLASRYIINDACVMYAKPMVYGSICEFVGQISVFNYISKNTAIKTKTYRDLFPYHDEVKDFVQPLGVIGALPGVVGSMQAMEVIKIILSMDTEILSSKLMLIDLLKNSFQVIEI